MRGSRRATARPWNAGRGATRALLVLLVGAGVARCESALGEQPTTSPDPTAGPVVTSVWGVAEDGATVTVMGRGFGVHALDIASSLGPDGWIETNPAGTPFDALRGAEGWDVGQASNLPHVTDERAHSGRQSVLARVDTQADGYWQSVLRYRHRRPFDRIYATFWVYFDPIALTPHRTTQWKFMRVNHNGTVRDQAGQVYFSSRHRSNGALFDYQWVTHCTLDCPTGRFGDCYAEATPTPFYAPRFGKPTEYRFLNKADAVPWTDAHPTAGEWNRVELYLDRGTIDRADATFVYTIQKPGQGKVFVERIDELMMWSSEESCRNPQDPWRYFQLQNYWDDDGSSNAPVFKGERADFYYDDLYLQFDTPARVELGDASVYEACRALEIQRPVAWSDGTVRVQIQRGALAAGSQAYLFVVDHAGRASNGIPIGLP